MVNVETMNKPFAMTEVKPLPPVFDQIRDDPETVAVFTDHVLAQWGDYSTTTPPDLVRAPVADADA